MKRLITTTLFALAATSTQAADEWYAGFHYSTFDVELSVAGFTFDTNPNALNLTVGKKFGENFAIEGLLGTGLSDDEIENTITDFELESVVGASLVGFLPISEGANLYGKLGYAQLEYDDSDGDPADASGAMFGVGLEFAASESATITMDYTQYPDGEYEDFDIDVEASAFSLGVTFKF